MATPLVTVSDDTATVTLVIDYETAAAIITVGDTAHLSIANIFDDEYERWEEFIVTLREVFADLESGG